MRKRIQAFLDKIRAVEQSNKTKPKHRDLTELQQLREEPRVHLQKDFDFHIKQLHLNGYAYGNKPGAELAKQLKRNTALSKIANMKMSLGNLVGNPKNMANCFSEFYAKLYNLHASPVDPAPHDKEIQQFLDSRTQRIIASIFGRDP